MAPGWLNRLKEGLSKTRHGFVEKVRQVVTGRATFDEELYEDLEALMLQADVGVETTMELIGDLRERVQRGEVASPEDLPHVLEEAMAGIMGEEPEPLRLADEGLSVIVVVGVNGVGKTTSIAKLAHYLKQQGHRVLLGAADTFRAAGAEQLEKWAERVGAELVRHKEGADPAAVAYDAVQAARARRCDVVIIDTAGRLHTKVNLMEELKKIRRVVAREVSGAPHEVLLVLDATTGQNALQQARLFHEAVELTGLVLTKLDGTAKGGVVIAVRQNTGIPVKFIGVGEQMEDLQPFKPSEFLQALFE